MKYDIAIIGAGPAGSTFSRLIDKKYSVLLIDKKTKEKDSFRKTCGGLLSTDAQKALSQFEITLPKDILVSPQIFAVKTIDVDTKEIRHYQRTYINMDRHKFDLWLTSMVGKNITKIIANASCIKRENGEFKVEYFTDNGDKCVDTATCIIGADGANSLVRKSLFNKKPFRKYTAIQQWFPEEHSKPFYSCIFDSKNTDCCSWSISKDNYLILGGAFPIANSRQRFENQKIKLMDMGFNLSQPLKTEACMVLRPSNPWDFFCGEDNAFLIGEAAGFISPSSLEGISYGVQSGRILAEVFNSGCVNKNARYKLKTLGIRLKLSLKLLKCPFMYNAFLRQIVMKSGITSIKIK